MTEVTVNIEPNVNSFRSAVTHVAQRLRWMQAKRHRARLIESGQYIKTSEQRGMGLMQFMGRVPEPYEPDYVGSWGKRLEQLRASTYPRQTLFPHHHGAALWMPSKPGSRHWPGCGCP